MLLGMLTCSARLPGGCAVSERRNRKCGAASVRCDAFIFGRVLDPLRGRNFGHCSFPLLLGCRSAQVDQCEPYHVDARISPNCSTHFNVRFCCDRICQATGGELKSLLTVWFVAHVSMLVHDSCLKYIRHVARQSCITMPILCRALCCNA